MPDLEALWSVRLRSLVPGAAGYSQYESAGVVVLETNKLFGGDSSYYYTGSYSTRNGKLTATVNINHYAGPANSILVGGPMQQGTVEFEEDERRRQGNGSRVIVMVGRVVGTRAFTSKPNLLGGLPFQDDEHES